MALETPKFVLTDVGLAAASIATPEGPYIHVTSFQVGSAYGYDNDSGSSTLVGDLLYEGTISSYSYIGDNTIDLVCRIPPDAGPFQFGEVAIILEDGTMLAKAVFSEPQTKYSSLGTNLALTYSFHALLRLDQSTAVFKITTTGMPTGDSDVGALIPGTMVVAAAWSDVIPPGQSANPSVSMMLVTELDNLGQATLIIQSSSTRWTPASTYYPAGVFALSNASTTWVEIAAANWPYLDDSGGLSDVEVAGLLVETSDGYFRSVASVQHIGDPVTAIRLLLNPEPLTNIPVVGDHITLHVNDPTAIGTKIADQAEYAKIAEYANRAGIADLAPGYLPLAGGELVGNVGVKTNRVAGWDPALSVFDLAGSNALMSSPSGTGLYMVRNAYHDGQNWRAKTTGVAVVHELSNAGANWYYAPAVATNNVSTLAMRVSFDTSGNITAVGDVIGFSDRKLKDNLVRLESALDKVCQLTGYEFDRTDIKQRQAGLIAQDVQKVLPVAVRQNSETESLGISYSGVIALLVEAIKELRAEIQAL